MSKKTFCDIYFIRHGETDWNVEGRLQGHTDIPLNVQGEAQARMLKEKFADVEFAAAFTSDLSRAKRTAQIVLSGKNISNVIETPELREMYMGGWEGRLAKDLHSQRSGATSSSGQILRDEYLSYKFQGDVESYAEAYERIVRFIRSNVGPYHGSSVLISSHGGVLRSLLYSFEFNPEQRWLVSNCAFLKLRAHADGQLTLEGREGVSTAAHS